MNPGRNPLLLILLNYAVGIAVSQGWVETQNHTVLVEGIADIIGYGIIIATTVVSLKHAVHFSKHPATNPAPLPQPETPPVQVVNQPVVVTQPIPDSTPIELPSDRSGLPPDLLPIGGQPLTPNL